MAFYSPNSAMTTELVEILARLEKQGRPGLHNSIAISWIRYNQSNPKPSSGTGAGWNESRLLYPASVVKLFYAVATEAWLQKDLIPETPEMRRALKDMIINSSNDATGLIIDLLTGTTSGPSLYGERWQAWQEQRQLINKWLISLNWSEMKQINCCQKTWGDGPYGRERDFYKSGNQNRNALTTAATARLLEAVMTESLISPLASKRIKELLSRSLDPIQRSQDPENQIDGFLGEGLPKGTRLWSKAGWMSQARNDAAWCCSPEGNPMLLVVFSQGRQRAKDSLLFPSLAKELIKLHYAID